ncbi:MAG: tyrosine-type recombinase/integrase [Rhodanobacter sp.]
MAHHSPLTTMFSASIASPPVPPAKHSPHLYDLFANSESIQVSANCADGHLLVMELIERLGLIDRVRPPSARLSPGSADRGVPMGDVGLAVAQPPAALFAEAPSTSAGAPPSTPLAEPARPPSANTVVIPAPDPPVVAAASMLLSTLRDRHLDNLRRGPKRATPATRDRGYALNLLIETVGDRPIKTLTPEDATAFANLLACWPARRTQFRQLDGLKAPAVADRAKREKLRPIQLGTQHKHLMHVNALMNWAIKLGEITESPFRFIDTRRYLKDAHGKKIKKKDIFRDDELAAIFDPKRVATYDAPHKFWVPLIAHRTGMRVNEIAQLYVDDVRVDPYIDQTGQTHQVTTFDITSDRDGQSVKTGYSVRRVPVPQRLFELGFDRYLEDVRASGAKHLFPGLPWNEGGPGRAVSQWVNDTVLRKECAITSHRKTLHSLRHTLITLMEREHIPKSIVCAINGHSTGNHTEQKNYIADGTVLEMREVLDSLPIVDPPMAPYVSERFKGYLAHAAAEREREIRLGAEGMAFKRPMGRRSNVSVRPRHFEAR